jgi:hypothetical protein
VAARRRSRRTAGEQGDLKRARATLEHGGTISILGLVGEAARRAADGRAELGGCGRTNLNYTGSSTRVHSRGLQRASIGIIPWPVG